MDLGIEEKILPNVVVKVNLFFVYGFSLAIRESDLSSRLLEHSKVVI